MILGIGNAITDSKPKTVTEDTGVELSPQIQRIERLGIGVSSSPLASAAGGEAGSAHP
jgi:hypothetical protein